MTEEMAMAKLKEGQLEWAAFLFERYKKPMYNYFFKITYDKEISKDMTQEVFYRMINYRKTFKVSAPFKPWLYSLARNVWLRQKEQKKILVPLFQIAEEASEQVLLEAQKETLDQALAKLPPEDREIIILVKIEKMNYQDIANILQVKEGTLRVRTHRILQRLKEIYFELAK